MGKLGKFSLFVLLILTLSLIITLPTIIGFINQVSDVNGEMGTVDFAPNDEVVIGYSITYELDGGVADNPNSYTLFTDTFTLNDPMKEGYKFLGWTGSNGNVPQLNVTVCTGSCGDLEFTANYKALAYLKLEDSKFKWFLGDDVTDYMFYVNETEVELNKESFEIDVSSLEQYFEIGANDISITYGDCERIGYTYYFYPTETFDNLTLSFDFERLSNGYSVSYTSDLLGKEIELKYSPVGELIYTYLRQGYVKPADFTWEEFFLQVISINNFNTVDYKLVFNGIEMIDLLKQIDSLYTETDANVNIALSGKLKFIFIGDDMREYIPNIIKVNVAYGSMYSEIMVYEGVIIDLTECNFENISCVLYRNSEYTVFLDLVGDDGVKYQTSVKFSEDYTVIGNSITVCTAEENYTHANLMLDEFNSMLSECKFYLNSEYYLKIKSSVDFSSVLHSILIYSLNGRVNEDWLTEKLLTLDVSQYFDIYKNDDDLVDFEYSLTVEFLTTTDWLWRA